LADHAPEWDMDARRVFGSDNRIVATNYLALSTWLLGDLECGRGLIEQAVREAQQSGDVATTTFTYLYWVTLEGCRNDPAATLRAAEALVGIAKEHNVAWYEAIGAIWLSWARARLDDSAAGAAALRLVLAGYLEQGNGICAPWFYGLVAELEAIAGRVEDALASVDAGLALAVKTGERWTDPLLFRRKGEILLHASPADPAPAVKAFRRAIEIAQQQGSRSFGLRAALSLAKICQSTCRPAEARVVLAPALEGFATTAEMPEIAEAQALIELLT
jgi:predicted ATPase